MNAADFGLQSMRESIGSLNKFLRTLERSTKSKPDGPIRNKDLALQMKGWAFKGYLLSSVKDKRAPTVHTSRNRTAIKEIVNSFQNSIDLFSTHFAGIKSHSPVMYFVYIQQSRQLQALGMLKEALNRSQEAIKLSTTNNEEASALSQLGEIYLHMGEGTEALKAFERSLQRKAYDLSLYGKIVECHKLLEDLSKNKWRKLLIQMQEKVEYYENHDYYDEAENGNRYRIIGKNDEVIFDDSKTMSEVDGSDVFTDSRFPIKSENNYIFSAKLSLNHTEFIHGRTAVHYAIFTAAERAALYEDAWHYLNIFKNMTIEKNAQSGTPFDDDMKREHSQARFVLETFTPGFYPTDRSHGIPSRVPIFIVGMMRSGSTLLESMLYAHPDIYTVGEESTFVDEVNNMIMNIPALRQNFTTMEVASSDDEITDAGHDNVTNEVASMGKDKRKQQKIQELIDEFGEERPVDPDRERGEYDFEDAYKTVDIRFDVNKIINRHAEIVVNKMISNARDMNKHTSKYIHDIDSNKKIKHVVDKMLLNHMNLGFIHLMYPNALIIHIMRDPLDTLVSCFRCNFGSSLLQWTLTIPTLYQGYQRYMEIMSHYRRILPKKRLYEVQYEKLLINPEKVLRDILKKLDLPWDPAVLNYHHVNRTVHTSSIFQVKKGLSRSSVGFWKAYKPQLRHLAGALHKLVDRLSERDELPFEDSMNWDLDEDFEYFHDGDDDDDDDDN